MSGAGGGDAGSRRAAGDEGESANFFEHLLEAFRRHSANLEGRPQTADPACTGGIAPEQDPAPAATARPRTSPPDAVARTVAVLLGGTLCEYAGGAPGAPANAPLTASAPAAMGVPVDGQEDLRRRSMRLALRETLEAGHLDGALARRSRRHSPDASAEVTMLGDESGLAESVLDSSALDETHSVMGASQLRLGDTSFDETRSRRGGFTSGLVDMMHLLGETLTPEGGMDGGLISMLRQLGSGDLDVTARQARQLGHVLAGDRLSDEDIQALPKARFNKTEEQTCAICLVAYKQGELLTQLPCNHFFHVACVAEWMQRATRCPLCRADCSS